MKKSVLSLILTGVLLIGGAVPAQADGEKYQSDEIKSIQEGIISWEKEQMGIDGKNLLDGVVLEGAGTSGSDWLAFSISRMKQPDNQSEYLEAMQKQVETLYQDDIKKTIEEQHINPTDFYRAILTINACGGDATSFGTDKEKKTINLVEDGVFNSVFEDLGVQGANGYIWALLSVDSKNYEEPEKAEWTREKLVDAILEKEQDDGGFSLSSDGDSDVDITAMALTALAPYKEETDVKEAIENGFSWLSEQQMTDGAMPSMGTENVESTDWTLIAVCSNDINPLEDARFIKENNSLLDGIFQFRTEDGGIAHSLAENENAADAMAGYQTLYALESYRRYQQGETKLFDLSDAESVEKRVPEEENSKTGNFAMILIAIVVVLVILVAVICGRNSKKKKKEKTQKLKKVQEAEEKDDWD